VPSREALEGAGVPPWLASRGGEGGADQPPQPCAYSPFSRLCILPAESSGAGIQVQITIQHLCYLKGREAEGCGKGSELLWSHKF